MGEKTNILVVDDDEVVRLSHQRSLTGASCNVETVWDAEAAVRALEAKRFDVVLLDLRMPGIDGISLLRIIKQRWPEIEVMVITGYPSVDTVKEAVRLGASDYLAKPVGPVDLIAATTRVINQKKWALRREPDEMRMQPC